MSWRSLEQILKAIKNGSGWEVQKQYNHLLECWAQVVQSSVAANTRPLYISKKVLWVATSSSVWAQNLSLQRYSLLKKLNQILSEELTDIRFSAAQWHGPNLEVSEQNSLLSTNQHPSQLPKELKQAFFEELPKENDPQSAFQNWQNKINKRSNYLPLCPQCHAPTPQGELDRWGFCVCCFSDRLSK